MINILETKITNILNCLILGYIDYQKMKKWQKALLLGCFTVIVFAGVKFLGEIENLSKEESVFLKKSDIQDDDFFQSTLTKEEECLKI